MATCGGCQPRRLEGSSRPRLQGTFDTADGRSGETQADPRDARRFQANSPEIVTRQDCCLARCACPRLTSAPCRAHPQEERNSDRRNPEPAGRACASPALRRTLQGHRAGDTQTQWNAKRNAGVCEARSQKQPAAAFRRSPGGRARGTRLGLASTGFTGPRSNPARLRARGWRFRLRNTTEPRRAPDPSDCPEPTRWRASRSNTCRPCRRRGRSCRCWK